MTSGKVSLARWWWAEESTVGFVTVNVYKSCKKTDIVIVLVFSIVVIELCYIGDNHELVIIVDSECVHQLEENRYLSFWYDDDEN